MADHARLIGTIDLGDGAELEVHADGAAVVLNAVNGALMRLDHEQQDQFIRLFLAACFDADQYAGERERASEPGFTSCHAAGRCVNGPEAHTWGQTCKLREAAQ